MCKLLLHFKLLTQSNLNVTHILKQMHMYVYRCITLFMGVGAFSIELRRATVD